MYVIVRYFEKSHIFAHMAEIGAHGVDLVRSRGKVLLAREKRTQGRTGGKKGVKNPQ